MRVIEVMGIRGFQTSRLRTESDLAVIVKAKQLCCYVLTATDKAPKKYRFTLVNRLQHYGLDIVESLFLANLVYVRGRDDADRIEERRGFQRKAYVGLKTIAYLAMIAEEQGCLLPKQFEQIASQVAEILRLLKAWANSDRKRFEG